ncbi:MAG: hypothetical protein U9R39_03790 [Campylobacterota bacterium]|nr:hypothetical protein [Campylobacterota bacterium]
MKYILIAMLVLFTGCTSSSSGVKKIFQTDDSSYLQTNYSNIVTLILQYKIKLDKRNPSAYNKQLNNQLVKAIKSSQNNIVLYTQESKVLINYVDYFNYAFDTSKNIKNRNDYLIVGMYKLVHNIYLMNKNHKFTSYEYDLKKLQKGHKNLQILRWKINNTKDKNGKYLFYTWQQNWQIELENQYNKNGYIDYVGIKNLKYLKNKKESLFNPSNSSFNMVINKIIFNLENSISILDMTPEELTKEILKSAMFII